RRRCAPWISEGGVSALSAAMNVSVVFRRLARALPAVWASRGRRTWAGSCGVTVAIALFQGRAASSTRSWYWLLDRWRCPPPPPEESTTAVATITASAAAPIPRNRRRARTGARDDRAVATAVDVGRDPSGRRRTVLPSSSSP